MTDKKFLKILQQAYKACESEFPTRCRMRDFEPGCLSCRMNVTMGHLGDLIDTLKWGIKFEKRWKRSGDRKTKDFFNRKK